MKYSRCLLFIWVTTLMIAGSASAQDYPSKSIRMIVPFAPGGASDFVARILAPRLSAVLGQQVFVENKAGAAGNIGLEAAAAAAPDGYTVFLGNVGTLAINPSIFGARQKVTVADLEPISLVANAPDMLVSTAALPVNSVAEFVEYARKNSDKMSFASPGSGSLNRLEMELFRNVSQLEMVHVPYKGGAGPALVDVVGGQVPIMFAPIPAVMQLVKAGRLKALAVASQERLPFMPEVPTMVESGYPQVVGGSWQALLFPAKTPQKIVMQFHAAATKVLAEDDVRQRLLQGGVEVAVSATPDHLRDFINEEARRWGAVAKVANATAD
jgi:tripartite-type tricarboxylate transporter receptor subunit TctC